MVSSNFSRTDESKKADWTQSLYYDLQQVAFLGFLFILRFCMGAQCRMESNWAVSVPETGTSASRCISISFPLSLPMPTGVPTALRGEQGRPGGQGQAQLSPDHLASSW